MQVAPYIAPVLNTRWCIIYVTSESNFREYWNG